MRKWFIHWLGIENFTYTSLMQEYRKLAIRVEVLEQSAIVIEEVKPAPKRPRATKKKV